MPDRTISDNQGNALIAIAREAIAKDLGLSGTLSPADTDGMGNRDYLCEKRGLFVTLHKKGQLRGCIGNIEPVSSIREALPENARAAAFKDSRFSPLTKEEFREIEIEISLLSAPVPLEYDGPDELTRLLVPYRDGVVLKKGYQRATFLPQVWEQLPDVGQFLSHLCMKAGLLSNAWQTEALDISVYRVQSFEENNNN